MGNQGYEKQDNRNDYYGYSGGGNRSFNEGRESNQNATPGYGDDDSKFKVPALPVPPPPPSYSNSSADVPSPISQNSSENGNEGCNKFNESQPPQKKRSRWDVSR